MLGKIFKYIREEIVFNFWNDENKLIVVIKDNSLIEKILMITLPI